VIEPSPLKLRFTLLGIDVCNNSQQENITEVCIEQWKKAAAGWLEIKGYFSITKL
jgi:hypothetical protein